MKPRMPSSEELVVVSCVAALFTLCLMAWSVVDPGVWPVLVALSVGQVIGTLSLLLFLVVVARDLRVREKLTRSDRQGGGAKSTPAK